MYVFNKYFLTLLLVSSIRPDTFASGKCDLLTSKINIDVFSHCKSNEMCDVKLSENYDEYVKECGTKGGVITSVDLYIKCIVDQGPSKITLNLDRKNVPYCFAKVNCTDSDIDTIFEKEAAAISTATKSVLAANSCTFEIKKTSPSNVEKVNAYVFAAALTLMSISTFM
jgi:hypothetical protein